MKGLKTMAKKKETEPKGADKKNEKINGEKTDNVEIEVEKEVSEAESLASQLKDVNDRLLRTLAEYDNFRKRSQKEKEAFTASRNISFLRTVTAFLPSFFFLFPDRIVVDRFIECFFPALMIIRTVAEKPHGFSCDCLRGHIV